MPDKTKQNTWGDPDIAYDKAIAAGRLSDEPNASNFAGAYMFMGHDDDGKALFKHINTRRYLA